MKLACTFTLRAPQLFAPLHSAKTVISSPRANTFPRTARSAIRQRTRWITGIALQVLGARGWRGNWRTRYWFWRDRKGLIANPLSFLANILLAIGVADLSFCS